MTELKTEPNGPTRLMTENHRKSEQELRGLEENRQTKDEQHDVEKEKGLLNVQE